MESFETKKMERDPMEMALSIDVVMDNLLKHFKVRDLLSCRQVSKLWNKAASSILRRRSTMIRMIYNEGYLIELEECMKQSSDFPLAGINFHIPWKFSSVGAREFFRNYGDRFTRLRFDGVYKGAQDLAPLVNYLPRLSILEILPPKHSDSGLEWPDSTAAPGSDDILKLPSVRTIRLLAHSFGLVNEWMLVNEEILREVLTAASSSVQIECLDVNPGIVRALQNAGQLRAVSVMEFYGVEDGKVMWRPQIDQLLSTELPSLTKLALHCCGLDGLERILFSSQHTLKELYLNGASFFMCSLKKLPVLTKLSRLSLHGFNLNWHGSLFHGNHGNKFPALKEIMLDFGTSVGDSSLSDDLFIVPSVSTIHIIGYMHKDGIQRLARSFPNVTEVRLDYGFYFEVMQTWNKRGMFEVWNVREFKHLEKLTIWNVSVKQPFIPNHAMDSFLTGIPIEICKKLLKQNQLNLKYPLQKVTRDEPCILQLENLKELIIGVCVKPGRGLEKLILDDSMTMVSVWYALEMMPNLRAKLLYEQERDKSVLEAAFKTVLPYVNLERFFY